MQELPEQVLDRIIKAVEANRKIFAVKIYKDATGESLTASKKAIEELLAALRHDDPGRFSPQFKADESVVMDEILESINKGNHIDAVKQYKDSTGCSLPEAREFIESLTQQLRSENPEEVRATKKPGCALTLLFVLASVVFWL
jgi:ribosomal protein L7/L12